MIRFLLVAATLLFSSVAALAQGNSSGALEISCWKREEGQQVACGPSPLQMERRFQIGSADFTHVGYITIINRTNKVRAIEVGEISPAYDPDDAQQPFWFGDVQKRLLHLRPGAKLRLKPAFVGRKRATRSYDPRPWVAPGTYEGTLIVRDKTGGDELRFTMTVFAYKPGGN